MNPFEKLKTTLFGRIDAEAQKCKKVSDLDSVFDKCLTGETAKQAKNLIKNRAAVESLLVAFTGDKDIGKKLDAIYQDDPKKGKGGKR